MAVTQWLESNCIQMYGWGWDPPICLDVDDVTEVLVCLDVAMTLQAALVVLQEDSYGRTLAVLLADSYM